jgi:hypothetical protein
VLPSCHSLSPSPSARPPLSLTIAAHNALYHNYITELADLPTSAMRTSNCTHSYPSVIGINALICFNAGLWGYSDWVPTLALIPNLNIDQVIVTSYTFLEAEEDYDTILQHCSPTTSTEPPAAVPALLTPPPPPFDADANIVIETTIIGDSVRWNFEPEENPYCFSVPIGKETAPAGAGHYRDNHYWQSFSITR